MRSAGAGHRGAGLGCLLAALGFSWALATTSAPSAPPRAATFRAAATSLRFSNPFLLPGVDAQFPSGGSTANDPNGFDLGDIAIGSQLVRYVNALGGFQPYTFVSQSIGSSGSAGLKLDPSGRVTGIIPASGTAPAAFTAQVVDATGDMRTGYFRVATTPAALGEFRFAMDRLPAAQVGVDYISNLQTIGGSPDATHFSVVPGSVRLNGAVIADLEYAGLTLSQDGTLAGRPLADGTLSFTARATNGAAVARDRTNSQPDQPLTISVAMESAVQSIMATTNALIKGDRGRPDQGFVSLQALVNLDGYSFAEFAGGRFVLRLGGATFQTTLNSVAQSRSGNLRVNLDAVRGRVKVQLRNTDMAAVIEPRSLTDHGSRTVVVEIEIGTTFRATEAVEFDVRSADSNDFKMQYRLGKQRQLGGLFQITKVKAADSFEGTAFRTNFLISHVKGRSEVTFGRGRQATVYIGPSFVTTVPLFGGRGRFAPPGLSLLRINPSNKTGMLQTYPLTEAQTGIPPASQSGGQMATFLLSIDLTTNTTLFSGDASQRIFPVVLRR